MSSNNSWTTLASLLRFKENRFYIIIYFYSSPTDVCLISTIGLASWNKLEPANRFLQIGIGRSAIFKVSIIPRPFPSSDERHWTFSPSNISYSVLTHPPDTHMVINDGLAILNITNITRNHYAPYYVWTDNAYGCWKKDDLRFSLASTSNNHNNDLYHFKFIQLFWLLYLTITVFHLNLEIRHWLNMIMLAYKQG